MKQIKFRLHDRTGRIVGYERLTAAGHWECQVRNGQPGEDEWIAGTLVGEIRCQFTGYVDANGHDIYGSDIVSLTSGETAKVIWSVDGAWKIQGWSTSLLSSKSRHCDVIGNVLSNPALLEAGR